MVCHRPVYYMANENRELMPIHKYILHVGMKLPLAVYVNGVGS